jgi:hypothetical protein
MISHASGGPLRNEGKSPKSGQNQMFVLIKSDKFVEK